MGGNSWRELLQAALMEPDPQRVPDRVQEARTAIMRRVDELMDDGERRPEHDEILVALNRLDHCAPTARRPSQ